MGRLTDKSKARRDGVTDRAIRKRRQKAKAMSTGPDAGELADIRYKLARAARAEDALAQKRGELVRTDELRIAVRSAIHACKSRLLTLPDVCRITIGLTEKQSGLVAAHVREALVELSLCKWNS